MTPHTEVEIVQAAVRDAAARLAAGGGRQEGLLYVGQRFGTYPDSLLGDPSLTDSAKVQYLFLSREALRGRSAVAMPTVTETAALLGQSPKTVSRDRLVLRLARWISLAEEVRDSRGRWRGVVYAVHDRSSTLDMVLAVDADYMRRLESSLDHADPYVRRVARTTSEALEAVIAAGMDPLTTDLNAWIIKCNDRANRGVHSVDTPQDPESGESYPQKAACTDRAKGGVHSVDTPQDPESGKSYPQKAACTDRAKGGVHSVDTPQDPESGESYPQKAAGLPHVNFTHGNADPHVNFTCGDQVVDIQEKTSKGEVSGSPHVKFTHGECSSSSYYFNNKNKNTTTTTTVTEVGKNYRAKSFRSLRWPDTLDDNQRRVIRQILALHAPPGLEQQLLDALALKMRDTADPLISLTSYLYRLCERARRGAFVPVLPSTPADANTQDTKRQAKQLASELATELRGLERLRDAAKGAARTSLDGQIARLRDRLAQVRPS